MKVLFLSTFTSGGGAANAAIRLMNALREEGVDVHMLALKESMPANRNVTGVVCGKWQRIKAFVRFVFERLQILLYNGFHRKDIFKVSIASTGCNVVEHEWVQKADIIHLHWINQGFLSINQIERLAGLGKPVVWSLHDMWPVTGICHLPLYLKGNRPFFCHGYEQLCGRCVQIHSRREKDLSYRILQKKKRLEFDSFYFVPVSNWLAGMIAKSVLVNREKIYVVPNTLDTAIFKPCESSQDLSDLPPGAIPLVLSAARVDHELKGLSLCVAALNEFCKRYPHWASLCYFVPVGDLRNPHCLDGLDMAVHRIPKVGDAGRLAAIYSSAVVTLSTSYVETFGQTLIEALACGCPVVSFDFGGQTDIISQGVNGYLVNAYDISAMADAIAKAIEMGLSENGRRLCIESIRKFRSDVVASSMIDVYKKVLKL